MRRFLILILALFPSVLCLADGGTSSATLLGRNGVTDGSVSGFHSGWEGGNFHKAKAPESEARFGFTSQGWRSLSHLRLGGKFSFDQNYINGRRWSDNFDPYSANPYTLGGDIPGNYSLQKLSFSLKASTLEISDRLWLGLGVDYTVADLSRSNDPRSRGQKADYTLSPSILIDLGSGHALGISPYYRFNKEKMLKLTSKSENIDRFNYYAHKGLAEYSKVGILGYLRRYVSHGWGADLVYAKGLNTEIHAGFERMNEAIEGESKETPGSYSKNSVWSSFSLHSGANSFLFQADGWWGSAIQTYQESVIETLPNGMVDRYWKTLFETVRYRNCMWNALASWRMDTSSLWYIAAQISGTYEKQKYISPLSTMNYVAITPQFSGGIRPGSFIIEGELECRLSPFGNISIDQGLEKEGRTMLLDNVVLPDYILNRTTVLQAGTKAEYDFKLPSKGIVGLTLSGSIAAPISSSSAAPLSGSIAASISGSIATPLSGSSAASMSSSEVPSTTYTATGIRFSITTGLILKL